MANFGRDAVNRSVSASADNVLVDFLNNPFVRKTMGLDDESVNSIWLKWIEALQLLLKDKLIGSYRLGVHDYPVYYNPTEWKIDISKRLMKLLESDSVRPEIKARALLIFISGSVGVTTLGLSFHKDFSLYPFHPDWGLISMLAREKFSRFTCEAVLVAVRNREHRCYQHLDVPWVSTGMNTERFLIDLLSTGLLTDQDKERLYLHFFKVDFGESVGAPLHYFVHKCSNIALVKRALTEKWSSLWRDENKLAKFLDRYIFNIRIINKVGTEFAEEWLMAAFDEYNENILLLCGSSMAHILEVILGMREKLFKDVVRELTRKKMEFSVKEALAENKKLFSMVKQFLPEKSDSLLEIKKWRARFLRIKRARQLYERQIRRDKRKWKEEGEAEIPLLEGAKRHYQSVKAGEEEAFVLLIKA